MQAKRLQYTAIAIGACLLSCLATELAVAAPTVEQALSFKPIQPMSTTPSRPSKKLLNARSAQKSKAARPPGSFETTAKHSDVLPTRTATTSSISGATSTTASSRIATLIPTSTEGGPIPLVSSQRHALGNRQKRRRPHRFLEGDLGARSCGGTG